jgi:hypothetical protein
MRRRHCSRHSAWHGDEAFNRLEGPDPQVLVFSWIAAAVEEQRALMGEHYWPYNIDDNRTALEAVTQFAYEQGALVRKGRV